MQPMNMMPADGGPTSPPMMPPMPFAGHPNTPLTSQENHFPMSFDPSMMPQMNPFDFNMMHNMWMLPMSMPQTTCWPTPTTSSSLGVLTPKTNDSGISLDSNNSEEHQNFARVQGRLNLVNNLRQFDVSHAEIQRRLASPECMNSSTLAALLRRAKTKDGGPQMRKDLEKAGIEMPNNRRKGHAHTTYSSLLEEEALLMANDLRSLAHQHFPVPEIAAAMVSTTMVSGDQERLRELQEDAFRTARFLKNIMDISNEYKVPVGRHKAPLPHDCIGEKMQMFSALTHGFGVVNHKTWLAVFMEIASQVHGQPGAPFMPPS